MFFGRVRIKGCAHASVDGWHVEETKAYAQLQEIPPRSWSLIDQLKVELRSSASGWMWISVAVGLGIGIAIANWILVGFLIFVALFFGSRLPGIIHITRHGVIRDVTLDAVAYQGNINGTDIWHGVVEIDRRRYVLPIKCPRLVAVIDRDGSAEVRVLIDPEGKSAFHLAHRPIAGEDIVDDREASAVSASQLVEPVRVSVASASSLAAAAVAAVVIAFASDQLQFKFETLSFVVGLCAGLGATRGGRGVPGQLIAVASTTIAYFAGILIAAILLAGGAELGELPGMLSAIVVFTFTHYEVIFLAIAVLLAWKLAKRPSSGAKKTATSYDSPGAY
jgi:hypothetical protein